MLMPRVATISSGGGGAMASSPEAIGELTASWPESGAKSKTSSPGVEQEFGQ